jgi:hypothetical protein
MSKIEKKASITTFAELWHQHEVSAFLQNYNPRCKVAFPLLAAARGTPMLLHSKDRIHTQLCVTVSNPTGNNKERYTKAILDNDKKKLSQSVEKAFQTNGAGYYHYHCFWVYIHDADTSGGLAHSYCLLIDVRSNNNQAVLFEPYGSSAKLNGSHLMCGLITSHVLKPNYGKNAVLFMNEMGPQKLSEERKLTCNHNGDPTGFCFAWCVHFVLSLITNTNHTRTSRTGANMFDSLQRYKDVIAGIWKNNKETQCKGTAFIREFVEVVISVLRATQSRM